MDSLIPILKHRQYNRMIGAILAAASLILDVGGKVAGGGAKNKEASATRKAAQADFSETARALALRQDQEAQASAQRVTAIVRETTGQRSSLRANAAAANVEGNTVDALDAQLMSESFQARDIVERNLTMTEANIAQNLRSAATTRQSRINGAQGASPLATGLGIAGSLTAFGYDWLRLHPDPDPKVDPS